MIRHNPAGQFYFSNTASVCFFLNRRPLFHLLFEADDLAELVQKSTKLSHCASVSKSRAFLRQNLVLPRPVTSLSLGASCDLPSASSAPAAVSSIGTEDV